MALSKPNKPLLLQTLALSVSFFIPLLLLFLASKVHSQQDSTTFHFDRFTGNEPDLIYQGYADVGSYVVHLTRPVRLNVGRVVYSRPVLLWDQAGSRQASFQTDIMFNLSVTSPFAPGDGIAIFISPVNSTIPLGSYSGNFGIFDSSGTSPSPLFAVEFDNFVNREWDPYFPHIGIDINSRISENVTMFTYDANRSPVSARITYDAYSKMITVVANSSFESYGPLTYVVDLKTILPQQVQVGLSASTGLDYWSDNQDVISWSFTSVMEFDNNAQNSAANGEDTYIPQYV